MVAGFALAAAGTAVTVVEVDGWVCVRREEWLRQREAFLAVLARNRELCAERGTAARGSVVAAAAGNGSGGTSGHSGHSEGAQGLSECGYWGKP